MVSILYVYIAKYSTSSRCFPMKSNCLENCYKSFEVASFPMIVMETLIFNTENFHPISLTIRCDGIPDIFTPTAWPYFCH